MIFLSENKYHQYIPPAKQVVVKWKSANAWNRGIVLRQTPPTKPQLDIIPINPDETPIDPSHYVSVPVSKISGWKYHMKTMLWNAGAPPELRPDQPYRKQEVPFSTEGLQDLSELNSLSDSIIKAMGLTKTSKMAQAVPAILQHAHRLSQAAKRPTEPADHTALLNRSLIHSVAQTEPQLGGGPE